MDTTLKLAAGGLTLALGLGGCGTAEPTVKASDPTALDTTIDQSMARLRALDIMEATRLVLELPAQALSCYCIPCPGSEWVAPYQAERARQAPRVAKLAEIAEAALHNPYLVPSTTERAAEAAAALAALRIVDVPSLVRTEPAASPQCYNLVCPADKEKADAANGMRVAQALKIAEDAKQAGL